MEIFKIGENFNLYVLLQLWLWLRSCEVSLMDGRTDWLSLIDEVASAPIKVSSWGELGCGPSAGRANGPYSCI